MTDPVAESTVRVMTWNIHGGVGPDRRYDLERVIRLVKRHTPHIVALQEIDTRGKALDSFSGLVSALGSHAAEARTIIAPDGHYGHAVISRWALKDVRLHNISVARREARYAIETNVETPYGPLHLAAVHLGLGLTERRRQAALLARIATCPPLTSVMMGDFNDWPWRGPVRRALARALPGRTFHRTYPARWPLFLLDRVYCRPRKALVRSWVDAEGRAASDHLPVFADITLQA